MSMRKNTNLSVEILHFYAQYILINIHDHLLTFCQINIENILIKNDPPRNIWLKIINCLKIGKKLLIIWLKTIIWLKIINYYLVKKIVSFKQIVKIFYLIPR